MIKSEEKVILKPYDKATHKDYPNLGTGLVTYISYKKDAAMIVWERIADKTEKSYKNCKPSDLEKVIHIEENSPTV